MRIMSYSVLANTRFNMRRPTVEAPVTARPGNDCGVSGWSCAPPGVSAVSHPPALAAAAFATSAHGLTLVRFRLNVCAFYGIRGAFRCCSGSFWRSKGVPGLI